MKLVPMLLAVSALGASAANARLNETWTECDARYGKPAREDLYSASYEKDGITATYTFDDVRDPSHLPPDVEAASRGMTRHRSRGSGQGRAIEVEYTKPSHMRLTDKEVKTLLDADAGEGTSTANPLVWNPFKRSKQHADYLRSDGNARARVYWDRSGTGTAKRVRVKTGSSPF